MAGAICLQGGHEFTSDCRDMDADVLRLAPPGRVVVLAGAARRGSDYDGASRRAQRHYEHLGVDVDIVPDPREGIGAATEAMTDDIALVILPGGSPQSLRDVLSGEVEQRLVELHAQGAVISGASAGAMVLCRHMVRPGGDADVVEGLGLVEGLALPHWAPGSDRGWPVPDDVNLWGLPECGGVVIAAGEVLAIGHGEPSIRRNGSWHQIPRGSDGNG